MNTELMEALEVLEKEKISHRPSKGLPQIQAITASIVRQN